MKFSEYLNEMAKARHFSSGFAKDKESLEIVKAFKQGKETYEFDDGRTYKFTKKILGSKLEKGQFVLADYNSSNQGAHVYEIKGLTDQENEKVNFDSVKDVLKKYDVASLKALENVTNDVHLVVKDLESGDEGAWFYLYNGRWSRGSGAEALTFSLVELV